MTTVRTTQKKTTRRSLIMYLRSLSDITGIRKLDKEGGEHGVQDDRVPSARVHSRTAPGLELGREIGTIYRDNSPEHRELDSPDLDPGEEKSN